MLSPEIAKLTETPPPWIRTEGPEGDVALSSRVRIARNLAGHQFPAHAYEAERHEIYTTLVERLMGQTKTDWLFEAGMSDLGPLDRELLVERRLISRELCARGHGSGVLVGRRQYLSAMINEEDHLRCQSIRPGLEFGTPYSEVEALFSGLEADVDFAFHDKFGYLTACPTNVGTAVRASVMLHLPALVFRQQIEPVLRAAEKLGLAVRGLFGEGTAPCGNLFQVSNQSTLGENEITICNRLERISRQLIQAERTARQILLSKDADGLADYVGRAFGCLKHARRISSPEALSQLFAVRFGIITGMFGSRDLHPIHQLIQDIHPAHLQLRNGRELSDSERDAARAVLIRGKITYIELGTKADDRGLQ